MKYHPALKAVKRYLKREGVETDQIGTLALRVVSREYHERGLIIDIRCSQWNDEQCKIEVCWLSEDHPMYPHVSKFNGHIVTYGEVTA